MESGRLTQEKGTAIVAEPKPQQAGDEGALQLAQGPYVRMEWSDNTAQLQGASTSAPHPP